MHDGVVVLDRDGRVMQHNPHAQRLLGGERLLGRPMAEILPGFGTATDFEVRGRNIGVRVLDTGTDEVFGVLFLEDTTRSREQAQQLKLAALGRLTANIAHEIRNPLAAISHAAELLAEERRDAQRVRLTRIIHDNTQRLERLVAEVLQLSRRDRQAPQRIRLKRWLAPFVEEFVANESVPRNRFALELGGDAAIEFDPAHLHQVMWNLLRNAVRYARAEPEAIRISLRQVADRVELSVVDNGPGVPASNHGQLFEPFFTTDSKGTGLGLYLARELCSANRALLEYVREVSGAHFRIVARTPSRA
jgi:two-component system sensor histidine kinase PilS (NtrC family)